MDEDHVILKSEAHQAWERARRAALLEDLLGLFHYKTSDLLSFEDVRRGLRLNQRQYRGLFDIPLKQIVGSVGRYRDFTRTFLPREDQLQQRWERIDAVAASKGLTPIEVYQVGEAYFVLDGNHRVSVARQVGAQTIQSHVWEFPTALGLSADADLDELLIKTEYADFLEHTRLDTLRPTCDIRFTTPGRYKELEYQISLYRQALEQIDGGPISYEDAVTAWYDMIYTPAVQIIRERNFLEEFPGRTEADLFVWLWQHNKELRKKHGMSHLTHAVDDLVRRNRLTWPESIWRAVAGLFKKT